tara:strand:- start:206 stop:577 length:372 start_codon:yes stop_codon:yes gene_type:complete
MRINELIIEKIKDRLEAGAEEYGEEMKLEDERVYTVESLEEALDMSIYLSASLLRYEHKYHRNLNKKEITSSVLSAIQILNKRYSINKYDEELAELILSQMKESMRRKYGTQRLETSTINRDK